MRRRPPRGADEGQVTMLVIGFVVVALALVAVVVSAAQVHLERTRLAALADLAALAAAEQVSDEAYFADGGAVAGGSGGDTVDGRQAPPGAGLAPTDDEVAAAVDAYLRDHPDAAARWTDLHVVTAGSPDGRTVEVTLAAVVRPAWPAWVLAPFGGGIAVGASSAARAW